MKVYISRYPTDWLVSDLQRNYMNKKYGYVNWPKEEDYTKTEKFLEKLDDVLQVVYNVTINQVLKFRKRKIKVTIHDEDLWAMDRTLGYIILPMLKRLKEIKHGSPFVDYEDVPENLRPTEEANDSNGYTDNTIHERWAYVLDEMIWSFEQITNDSGSYMKPDGSRWTTEELIATRKRESNGFRLFGKYYQGLWD